MRPHSPEISAYFNQDGRLTLWPSPKRKELQRAVLDWLADHFAPGTVYSEKQVTDRIRDLHLFGDAPLLRRELIEAQLLTRDKYGKEYQRNPAKMPPVAIYVHIPFCPTKCGYCDFNSYAMAGEIMPRTVDAMIQELERSPWLGRPAKTIFFGGGTPTFLEEYDLIRLFKAVVKAHPPSPDTEITSEANPGTVDMPKFRAMRNAGFNRISLGAQSFQDTDLLTLGRVHRSGEIERAVSAARQPGSATVNLDLMFALPNQSRHAWNANLDRALALKPDHLSLYCLTIEPNTAFYKKRSELALPDEDAQVEMYDDCLARMSAEGFEQYEISNFCKPGRQSQHNLCYWHNEEYLGYGPGAVGCVRGPYPGMAEEPERTRYTNLKHPDRYCAAIESGQPLAFEQEPLAPATLNLERIMLGLRLNDGFPADAALRIKATESNAASRGWLVAEDDRIRLTPEGRHFCSEVALELS